VFKTLKTLGGRAVVCDSFDKSLVKDASLGLDPLTTPGAGIYAHRDGYNVLYGDWHAKWYGDPQQRVIWWTVDSSYTGNLGTSSAWAGLGFNAMLNVTTINRGANGGSNLTVRGRGADQIWHMFDNDAGVDVGVDK
jgi:prepilin-type processing-associated H-X9-DG protein